MNARHLLLVALAAVQAGCISNDASVRLYAMCFPPTPSDTGCAYAATCGTIWLGGIEGDITNTSLDGSLVWPVQVDNQRPANVDRAGGVETATAWVEGFKISYSAPGLAIPDANVGISDHPVNPAASTVLIAPVVPQAVTTFLSPRITSGGFLDVVAELRAYGSYRGDGSSFETGPFQITARLWNDNPALTDLASYCPATSPTPVYGGTCPQPMQSGVTLCSAP